MWSSWVAVGNDVFIVDVHRFVRSYSEVEGAALVVDGASLRRHGRIRSWTRYYLDGAPNSTWCDTRPIELESTGTECWFVATAAPKKYRPTPMRPWRALGRLRRVDPRAAEITVVGTCPLEISWALPPRKVGVTEALFSDGFEAGKPAQWLESSATEASAAR